MLSRLGDKWTGAWHFPQTAAKLAYRNHTSTSSSYQQFRKVQAPCSTPASQQCPLAYVSRFVTTSSAPTTRKSAEQHHYWLDNVAKDRAGPRGLRFGMHCGLDSLDRTRILRKTQEGEDVSSLRDPVEFSRIVAMTALALFRAFPTGASHFITKSSRHLRAQSLTGGTHSRPRRYSARDNSLIGAYDVRIPT
ncbi:unnamed protein product [Zymoseptoria tritici ST99CH_3D1]|nr:unnamed protein product [Zymoseptoria tritici ST99CH_3D1]